jgi:hypothetical protein
VGGAFVRRRGVARTPRDAYDRYAERLNQPTCGSGTSRRYFAGFAGGGAGLSKADVESGRA